MFSSAFFFAQGKGHFAVPYDSTQGVPGIVFVFIWIIILAFLVRLAWEYRDAIFKPKDSTVQKRPKSPRK